VPPILKIAIPVPLPGTFDYLPPPDWNTGCQQPGVRVEVPFGRTRKVGVLLDVVDSTSCTPDRLRACHRVLDAVPLFDAHHLAFLCWISRYYHHPVGETLAAAMTAHLRKGLMPVPACETQSRLFPTLTTAPVSLTRSPRQAALLASLLSVDTGLTRDGLRALPFEWRSASDGLIRKGLAEWRETATSDLPTAVSPPLTLNAEQALAVKAVTASLDRFQVFLLEGVTGSGKTEVYLHLAQAVLARGRQVLILLPEISLTPQLEQRFRDRLAGRVAVFHSGLAEGERDRAWSQAREGTAQVLLGARSAALLPMQQPGLLILDEEHDPSYKQQEGLRFSARDITVMRARQTNIPVMLGSATPSMETCLNAFRHRYHHLQLTQRAGGASPPVFLRLDIRAQPLREGLSLPLIQRLQDNLARGEQSLLFINRRGFAPTCICHGCGWVAECPHCDARLVIHAGERLLRCHHCGYQHLLSNHCPQCQCTDLRPLGLGTERVESSLSALFPTARLARIDRDSIRRKGSLEQALKAIQAGDIDLLVGTQMLAKGHHFPNVTLVALMDVDAGLYSTDFRSAERTAQLIIQVAGRAGRANKPGQVILQTRHPDHPLLLELTHKGYAGFMQQALKEREAAGLPPFSCQALIRAEARDGELSRGFLERIAEWIKHVNPTDLVVLGPVPAPLARRADRHRFQLLLQTPQRASLHHLTHALTQTLATWPEARTLHWSLDIDPVDLY
jgi:primosomal protein N' (replication factor Y)